MRGAFPLAINVRVALLTGFGFEEEILGDFGVGRDLNGRRKERTGGAAALLIHSRRRNGRIVNFKGRLPINTARPPVAVRDRRNDQNHRKPARCGENPSLCASIAKPRTEEKSDTCNASENVNVQQGEIIPQRTSKNQRDAYAPAQSQETPGGAIQRAGFAPDSPEEEKQERQKNDSRK